MNQSRYLIYTCWTTVTPSGGSIAGSLLHDLIAYSEAEAKQHVLTLKEQASAAVANTTYRYTYIENRPEWWP
jgi:hypothetical protein